MKIYLAGPDVFRADASDYGKKLQVMCQNLGLTALWPLDDEVDLSVPGAALKIKTGNLAMIRAADAVTANIVHFRGPNMDPGTAYEIGYAEALGKPVYLYGADNLLAARTSAVRDRGIFPFVENFGLPENLMISAGNPHFETVLDALLATRRIP